MIQSEQTTTHELTPGPEMDEDGNRLAHCVPGGLFGHRIALCGFEVEDIHAPEDAPRCPECERLDRERG